MLRTDRPLEDFLSRFPSGKHHTEAANTLAALAVLTTLKDFANAWNAMDINAIVATQPDLSRKKLREQLAGVRNLRMTISPLSAPSIAGDRATVLCRRLVSQQFSDGTLRESPSMATFVLAKRSGKWIIESVE
jgi:hypothetical protein